MHSHERLDDLGQGLKILQSKEGYAFTSDAVILANLVKVKRNERVADLGCGSGIIAILLAAKRGCFVTGIEIQDRLANMAKRSVELNNLTDKIKIECMDIKGASKLLGIEAFDVVVSNPPYGRLECYIENPKEQDIAKYEVCITLAELIREASLLLKYGGTFFVIYKAARLDEILAAMRENRLVVKEIIPIQPKPKKDIDTVIVVCRKCGGEQLIVRRPLILYDDDGNFSEELRRLYGL